MGCGRIQACYHWVKVTGHALGLQIMPYWCIAQISAWMTWMMTTNLLCLNPSKPEFLIIGIRELLSKLTYSSDLFPTDLTSPVPYSSPICSLGVILGKKKPYLCRPHHQATI